MMVMAHACTYFVFCILQGKPGLPGPTGRKGNPVSTVVCLYLNLSAYGSDRDCTGAVGVLFCARQIFTIFVIKSLTTKLSTCELCRCVCYVAHDLELRS